MCPGRTTPTGLVTGAPIVETEVVRGHDAALIAQLRRQIFDLHTVFDIARRFHAVPDTDALLDGILLAAVEHLGVGAAAAVIGEPDQPGHLTRRRSKGWEDATAAGWNLTLDSPLARVLVEQKALMMASALGACLPAGDPQAVFLRKVGCELVAPILARGQLRGALFLSGKLNETPFDSDDRQFLGLLLEQFTVALDNARLYEAERQTAAELLRTQERLARAEKLLALGRLSAAIAHEVRNPLGIIKNYIELIRPAFNTGSAEAERLDIIASEVSRIDRILAGLLGAFHPGRRPPSSVGLGDVIAEVNRFIAPRMTAHGIDVVVDIPQSLPSVVGDAESLRQVFLNLAMNAKDAMPNGGALSITAEAEGKWVAIRFTDAGPGIDPEIQDTLFDPFTTTKDRGEGTGLGLSICQSLLDGFGGTISTASVPPPGHGAIFTVRLPQSPVEDDTV
jgi:signal transduction histidine kinase